MLFRIGCYLLVPTLLPTVLSCGAHWHWTLELASHFPVQCAVGLIPALLIIVWLRQWKLSAIAAVALVYNVALLVPLYLPASQPEPAAESVRIVMANVHTGNREYERFIQLVRDERPDIVAVVEVDRAWVDALQPLAADYPYQEAAPRFDNFGVAIFSRLPLEDVEVVELADSEVPTILANFQLGGKPCRIIVTHPLPPVNAEYARARNGQLTELAKLASERTEPVIVVGDLNATSWSPAFADLLSASGLRDTRRGFGIQATWPLGPTPLSIPLDHALVSPDWVVLQRGVCRDIGSDHRPILVELALAQGAVEQAKE